MPQQHEASLIHTPQGTACYSESAAPESTLTHRGADKYGGDAAIQQNYLTTGFT